MLEGKYLLRVVFFLVSYKLHGIVTACVVIAFVNKSVHDKVQVDIIQKQAIYLRSRQACLFFSVCDNMIIYLFRIPQGLNICYHDN